MKLATKFNLLLLSVFLLGLVVTAVVTYGILARLAQGEVADRARLMMQAAFAMRGYTVDEIRPLLLPHMDSRFLPQTVPAYAATRAFAKLRQVYSEYTYKEATLNPTNPRNRATDWESDLVQQFENYRDTKEITGVRSTPTGQSFFLAHPIRITKQAGLGCHSAPSAAPASLVALYGATNGFGWKLGQVVGAQIVSVPMSVPMEKGRKAFAVVMSTVVVVLLMIMVALHLMLRRIVTRRLQRLSALADAVSTGNLEAEPFQDHGKDELSVLAASFQRMRFSLEKALKLLET